MLWQELSWPAIAAANKQTPVIIPLGSCEQHGHHLPLFVDTIQVSAIAERVERALAEKVFLLPTLWLGSSHHHRDFPGTISVPPLLYARVIQDIARSILRAGFRRIFFLNGHGGNRTPAADALAELVAEDDVADEAYLVLANWWEVAAPALKPEKLGMSSAAISHACEFETSLMLAVRPDLVDMHRVSSGMAALKNDWHESEGSKNRVAIFRRFHRLTAAGSMGNSKDATDAKGKSILDAVSAEIVAFLTDFAEWPELPKIGPA